MSIAVSPCAAGLCSLLSTYMQRTGSEKGSGAGRTSGRLIGKRTQLRVRKDSGQECRSDISTIRHARYGRKKSNKRSAEAMLWAPYLVDAQTINHNVGNPGSLAVQRPSLQSPFHCGPNKPSRAHAKGAGRKNQKQPCEIL